MKLRFIIPVYNEEDPLENFVESVMAIELGSSVRRLVVSNDGSRDDT